METPDKGMRHLWAGQSGMAQDFITLLRKAHNLKRLNCLFSGFHISYFQTLVDRGTETMESETVHKGNFKNNLSFALVMCCFGMLLSA